MLPETEADKFQYISCYSLSVRAEADNWQQEPFQYISCYSLSELAVVKQTTQESFNTSHVTLYHVYRFVQFAVTLFQYISCYSLSDGQLNSESFTTSFQYISCYSLSEWGMMLKPLRMMFQYISCYSLSQPHSSKESHTRCFNTSHVTLYLRNGQDYRGTVQVSIHLMLLFIRDAKFSLISLVEFQYISCYSLSTWTRKLKKLF